jgi:hypothetical protein
VGEDLLVGDAAPHATASPSMMQDRERSLAIASTMSGNR